MSGQADIIIEQGATFAATLLVKATNLSGYSAQMVGRATHESTGTVFNLTTSNGGLAISYSAPDSTIAILMAASTTAALSAPQHGVYDICWTSPASARTRAVEGSFSVTPEVSHA